MTEQPDELSLKRYALIGIIVVEANALEFNMRALPLNIVRAQGFASQALTANMTMAALIDVSRSVLEQSDLTRERKAAGRRVIAAARAAYDRRNEVVHGVYFGMDEADAFTFSLKARKDIKATGISVTVENLADAVSAILKATDDLSDYISALRPAGGG